MLSCGVLLAFYVVLLSALEDAVSCPEEWSPHGDYCYQLRGTTSRTSRIWVAARHVCRKKGYLVSIHSRSEQAFVTQLVLNTSNIANMHSVFIGLSSRTSRGGYRWSDGSPVSYTYWKPGFRSKSGKQCVAIETESPGYWTDRNCDDALAYVCKMTMNALVPTQAPPTQANSNVYCKSRWQQYGDRCYKMAPSQAVYSTARQSCIAENAELLSINSVYEQAYILSTLRRKGDIWLGLNDVRTEGEYVWTDGSNVTFTEWGLGQPNDNVDSSHRDCVNLFASTGLWNDRNCNRSTLDYICEMAATQTQPPTKPATNCPTGWLPYSGHCYWFNVTANLNYKLAESYCVSLKSHLVHINDIYENAYIASQYPLAGGSSSATEGSKHFWIGLHKMNPDGVYIWTDGYPVEMTSWRQGEPNSGKHGNNCTEIFVSPSSHLASGFWNNSVCHRRKGVICEQRQDNAPATVAPIPTQPSPGTCVKEWTRFGDYCYKFHIPIRLSWLQAQQRCQQYGANLISIHNGKEQNFVRQQAVSDYSSSMWIGLADRNLEGGYVWSDGSPAQFTNWNDKEPNDDYGQEDCVEMYLSKTDSKWNDESCGKLRYFGCKIRVGTEVRVPTATVPPYYSKDCPKGTYSYGPYCYKFVQNKTSWSVANKSCGQDGHLVSITSVGEEEFLANTIKAINNSAVKHMWIGLSDLQKEGTYEWSDRVPIDFIYWGVGEPNNNKDEDCVELVQGQYWNDRKCATPLSYICKSPRPGYVIPRPHHPEVTIWGYCPRHWKEFGSYCYQANHTNMTWPDAEKECMSAGGHLASILNANESVFITNRVLNSSSHNISWIGLNDRENEHAFVWSDGSPVLVVSWQNNQPSDFDGQQNCVTINRTNGGWKDLSCGSRRPFVCKRPKISYPSKSPPTLAPAHVLECTTTYIQCLKEDAWGCRRVSCPNNCSQSPGDVFGWQIYSGESSICTAAVQAGLITEFNAGTTVIGVMNSDKRNFYSLANKHGILSRSQASSSVSFRFPSSLQSTCTPGWVSHKRSCYLFVGNLTATSPTISRSWSQVHSLCRLSGANLLTVDDALEQAFIRSQLPTGSEQGLWIGLHDISQQGRYVWTNGVPYKFAVWAHDQPNRTQHQNCVLINPEGDEQEGTWKTANCNTNAGYICEKLNEGPVPTDPSTPAEPCPIASGWLSYGTSCYWATLPGCAGGDCFLSWLDARSSCKAMNDAADLTSIDSYDELRLAQYTLPKLGWERVWTGLNDIEDEGIYVWSDGSPVGENTFDWAPGQPDDSNGTQNCVVMLLDGTISDENCNRTLPYGCEIHRNPAPDSKDHGLSAGAVAGIAIATLAIAVLLLVVVCKRKRRIARYSAMENDSDDEEGLLQGDDENTDDG